MLILKVMAQLICDGLCTQMRSLTAVQLHQAGPEGGGFFYMRTPNLLTSQDCHFGPNIERERLQFRIDGYEQFYT